MTTASTKPTLHARQPSLAHRMAKPLPPVGPSPAVVGKPLPLPPACGRDVVSSSSSLASYQFPSTSATSASATSVFRPTHSATHSAQSSLSAASSDRPGLRRPSSDSTAAAALRLRSNSGLSLHTNSAALRRYTDYNADGSPRVLTAAANGNNDNDCPLFSWATVRAVLGHRPARDRLWAYTRTTTATTTATTGGGSENLAFLDHVDAYHQALVGVTALMATISTTYTCTAATAPLRLPPHLAQALHTDVAHVSSSILPGLAVLFGDVDAHVKERVVRDIFPGFVQHQLGVCLRAALATSGPFSSSFTGLGHSFCLMDPRRPDTPLVYASDSFAQLLGYACAEDLPRTGVFRPPIRKDNKEAFTEELVLTRPRDGRPFWSLVSACPLTSASGRGVRFLLGSLVDVSDAVRTQRDMLHALAAQPLVAAAAAASSFSDGHFDGHVRRPSASSEKKSSFFNPFSRRRRNTATNVADISPTPSEAALSIRECSDSPGPPLSAYARFMVLQFVPGDIEAVATTATPARLKVASVSKPMLALLGGHGGQGQGSPTAHDTAVLYHDVFSVLRDHAGSPSVSPAFCTSVCRAVAAAEPVAMELCLPVGGPATGLTAEDDDEDARMQQQQQHRLMSHWTPLKEVDGQVAWVVLVLSGGC